MEIIKIIEKVLTKYYAEKFEDDLNAKEKDRTSIARYYLEFLIPKQQSTMERYQVAQDIEEREEARREFFKKLIKEVETKHSSKKVNSQPKKDKSP